MIKIIISVYLILFSSMVYASQSTITEGEGYACMGDDKSKKQTEQTALIEAKRNAVEKVKTYLKSETTVKDFKLEKDVIQAYTHASVRIIEEVSNDWHKDPSRGECFTIKIKAEVIPEDSVISMILRAEGVANDAGGPLNVKIRTDKKEYKDCDKIKVFLSGNKPFYARVIYRDASGKLVQILPNRYRSDNYFNGNVIYEIPSGPDKFELGLTPPYGSEEVKVFASTAELGEISFSKDEDIFVVQTAEKDLGIKSRGIKIKEKSGNKPLAAEFFEDRFTITTEGNCSEARLLPHVEKKSTVKMVIQDMHSSYINGVAFSPDGQYLISGADDNAIRLWNLDGKLIRTLNVLKKVRSVQFSPDGRYILSCSDEATIQLWGLDGTPIRTWDAGTSADVGTSACEAGFSKDGGNIISFSRGVVSNGTVKLWNIRGDLIKTFSRDAAARMGDVRVSSDGKYVVTQSLYDGDNTTFKLWKIDGTLIKTFEAIRGYPRILAVSPNAKMIAVLFGNDMHFELWGRNGNVIKSFNGKKDDYIGRTVFSTDGTRIILGFTNNRMELWKSDGGLISKIGVISAQWSAGVIFSSDGKYIATADPDSGATLWTLDGQLVKSLKGQYNGKAGFDPHDKNVVWVLPFEMELWNLVDNSTKRIGCGIRPIDEQGVAVLKFKQPTAVSCSPDGKYIAVGGHRSIELRSPDGSLSRTIKDSFLNGISTVTFSPDGKYLGIRLNDGNIEVRDLNGLVIRRMKEPTHHYVGGGEFSFVQNGRYIISGFLDRTIRIWNANGTLEKTINLKPLGVGYFSPMAFSPDGKYLSGVDGVPRIWTANGDLVATLDVQSTTCMVFSPDSRSLLTGAGYRNDRTVRLWNIDGTLIKTIDAPGPVQHLAVSPDGNFFLTASNRLLTLWSIDGTFIKNFEGHLDQITSVAFSPDGNYTVSVARGGALCLWNLKNDEYVTFLRSGDEWIFYTPDGYFDASKHGGSLVTMVNGMNVWGIDQFALRNNRPDIILKK